MFWDIIFTFLISFSPFGEARAGIPYGELNGIPILWVLLIGLLGNLLIFPIFYKAIEVANKYLWKHKAYKKSAIYLALRARTKTKDVIQKYGVWGLMVFVMIPLPVTGAYIGTIAAFIFGISYQKSLIAISTGITISSIMVASFMHVI
ncbi:MAG: small multi-drug export protein [Flavobacteriales bacterium]|nr:small multi-drug export protein [Flavobacteriales bacterium]